MATRTVGHISRSISVLGLVLVFAVSAPGEMYGPTPYLQSSDSPFSGVSFTWFHLEDFDDAIWSPGYTLDNGNVSSELAISGEIDSVGLSGNAWCTTKYVDNYGVNIPPFVTFFFLVGQGYLPSLPTHAGIVWTDGYGPTKFEAFDSVGTSLGSIVVDLGVYDEYGGQPSEDRFFGVSNPDGIGSIRISTSSFDPGMIEVDHLQYGFAVVPLPGGFLLGILGLGYAGTKLRRGLG